MISAEITFMTFLQKLAPDVEPWLKSLYKGYTEQTNLHYYRNNATLGDPVIPIFNHTIILRSRVGSE